MNPEEQNPAQGSGQPAGGTPPSGNPTGGNPAQNPAPGGETFSPPWLNFQPGEAETTDQNTSGDFVNPFEAPVENSPTNDTGSSFLEDSAPSTNPFASFEPEAQASTFDPFNNPFAPQEAVETVAENQPSEETSSPSNTGGLEMPMPPETTPAPSEELSTPTPNVSHTSPLTNEPVFSEVTQNTEPTQTMPSPEPMQPMAEVIQEPVSAPQATPASQGNMNTSTQNTGGQNKPSDTFNPQRNQGQGGQSSKQRWKDKKKDRPNEQRQNVQNTPNMPTLTPNPVENIQVNKSSLDILDNFYQSMLAEEDRYKRDLDDIFDQINEENTRHKDEIANLEEQKKQLRAAHREKTEKYKDMLAKLTELIGGKGSEAKPQMKKQGESRPSEGFSSDSFLAS